MKMKVIAKKEKSSTLNEKIIFTLIISVFIYIAYVLFTSPLSWS